MIIFLTLCYCAFLAIMVKIGVIKPTSFWKASPLIWVTLLLIFLFIPMNWGAPSGPVNLYQNVVSITPNVSGEVTEVHAVNNQVMTKGDVLFTIDPTVYRATVDQLEASLVLSRQRLDQSERLFRRGAGSEYDVQRYDAEVKGLIAQIAAAHWNLDNCTVRAPGDGYPVAVTLEPGNRVTNMRSVMAYVVTTRNMIAGINQIYLRHIEPGQPVEIALKLLPGKMLTGTVVEVVHINPQGQLPPSGQVPMAPTAQDLPLPFGVIIAPDEASMAVIEELGPPPGGAFGTAAIYTESASFSHLIRKVIIRLEMWLNFVSPV
jgi:hypothetical protein